MPNIPSKTFRPIVIRSDENQRNNSKSAVDFYNSSLWRGIASNHKDNNPLCYECLKDGQIIGVQYTDHTIPIIHGGDPLDQRNLGSLCSKHHSSKSAKEKKAPLYEYQFNNDGYKIPVLDDAGQLIKSR